MSDSCEFQTPTFVAISRATSGALVNANANKKICVVSYVLVSTSANGLKFQSANTDLTGAMAVAANGGISSGYSTIGHFQTAVNEALNLNMSSNAQVSGHLTYVLR